jgi:hypothetical protein
MSDQKNYRTWKHRIAAVAFGFLVIAAFEGLCRMAGWGETDPHIDPFVSFSAVEPLFRLNPISQRYEIRPERQPYFVPDSFPRKKTDRTFRVFCLGGSTVQGRPYSINTSFSTWLRLSLECAYPDRIIEVVNCGGVSYASYRLVPIFTECIDYEPDLIIVCAGQNEFLEDRTYAGIKKWSGPMGAVARPLSKLRLYRSFASLLVDNDTVDGSRPILKSEVDALLDYRRGLEAYRRDDEWRAGVEAHFDENLRRMIVIAGEAAVPLLMLAPPVNLKDCPPFKSESSPTITTAERARCEDLLTRANSKISSAPAGAAQLLAEASKIDSRNASTHYALGQCYLVTADFSRAHASFSKALDEDICPLRILNTMRNSMRELCQETKTPFIDLQALFENEDVGPVIGNGLLVDHIHPSFRGHQMIANRISDSLADWILPDFPSGKSWTEHRAEAYRTHLDSLDDLYYAHGRQRLGNLQRWTQGRTSGLPIEMHKQIERK